MLPLAPRASRPLDWAATQNSLGNALSSLGQRETGTSRLEEAAQAHRLALEERTRERVPLQWATTRMSEGRALLLVAERSGSAAVATAAATALRNAWSAFRDSLPHYDGAPGTKIGEAEALVAKLAVTHR